MTAADDSGKPPEFPRVIWGATQLAALLGQTTRNLQLLAEKGIAVKTERGKYDVFATVRNVINDLRAGTTDEGMDAKGKWEVERARLTKERADQMEIKNALLRGEIVLIEDAAELLRAEAGSVRAAIEGSEPVIIDALAGKINTHAQVAMAVREAHQQALEKLTLDTDNPARPKSNQIPKEFLPDDDPDAGDDEGERG